MHIIKAHVIALDPTAEQEDLLCQAVGVARFAYNWALDEWKRQYEAGEKPTEGALQRKLNAIKRVDFPWMLNVPKGVPQQAIKNLGKSFKRFFRKDGAYPKFKKKGKCRDRARFDNGPGTFIFDGRRIRLPVIGWVKMRESLRLSGKPLSATVSRVAGRWFVSIPVEMDVQPAENQGAVIGIDLGISTAATLSTGEKLDGPKPLAKTLRRLKCLSRAHSRKALGSANRRKLSQRLARLHARIANIRHDWLHKTTSCLTSECSRIGIEDLNVQGMQALHGRHIADVGFYEFRRQIEYKAPITGCTVVVADRWYPSSKTCSACGAVAEKMPLSIRAWTCSCGAHHDRDVNAAKNLRAVALAYPEFAGKVTPVRDDASQQGASGQEFGCVENDAQPEQRCVHYGEAGSACQVGRRAA